MGFFYFIRMDIINTSVARDSLPNFAALTWYDQDGVEPCNAGLLGRQLGANILIRFVLL